MKARSLIWTIWMTWTRIQSKFSIFNRSMSDRVRLLSSNDSDEEVEESDPSELIYVVFYRRNHATDSWREVFAIFFYYLWDGHSYWNKSYTHVELCVNVGPLVYSYGITAYDKIIHRIDGKRFENPKYEEPVVYQYKVSKEDRDRVVKFMERRIKKKGKYDHSNHWNFVPIVNWFRKPSKDWFCSKLVCEALKRTREIQIVGCTTDSNRVNPQMLYDLIHSKGKRVGPLNVRNFSNAKKI
jgi:hypothetical protein